MLREAYCRLIVDATSEPGKALARSLKIPTDAGALPQIVVRDAQGGSLVSRDAGDIFADAESNATNLVEFLERHACEPLDARNLWEGGLAQARKSNRRVLLVHASSGRDDSDRILRYLDATRNVWEKDFILVRIDDRWTNSQDVLEEIGLINSAGSAALAILDARGKVKLIANYGRRNENETHPRTSGQSAEDLLTMFRDNSRHLTEDDLWSLRIALDALPQLLQIERADIQR